MLKLMWKSDIIKNNISQEVIRYKILEIFNGAIKDYELKKAVKGRYQIFLFI